MKTQRRETGDTGEDIACEYLSSNGYSVVERNYATKFGEIDIIARERDVFVFIEVKTAFEGGSILPEENITFRKIGRLLRTIEIYLTQKRIDREWRLDSIAVTLNRETRKASIRHIKNINIA